MGERRTGGDERRRPGPSRKGLRPRRRGWAGRARAAAAGPRSVPCAGGGKGGGGSAGLQHVRLAVAAALCVALTRSPAPSRTGPHWPGRLAGGPLCLSPLFRQQDGGSDRSARRAEHPGTARASESFLRTAPPCSRSAPPLPRPCRALGRQRVTAPRRALSRRWRLQGARVSWARDADEGSRGALWCHCVQAGLRPAAATNKARRVSARGLRGSLLRPHPRSPAPARLRGLRPCARKDAVGTWLES